MKNIYSGFLIGVAGMMLYTIYDDHKKWNEHKAKYRKYYPDDT